VVEPIMESRGYYVPAAFPQHLGIGNGRLEGWLEERGIRFSSGAFAFFEPGRSVVIVHHFPDWHDKIVALIEPMVPDPQPQILCTPKLEWRHGEEVREIKAVPVVVLNESKAKVEITRGQLFPEGDRDGEAVVIDPLGLQWEMSPVLRKGMRLEVSGEVIVRVPKGANPADFMDKIHHWDLKDLGEPGSPQDVYRAKFSREIPQGESVEFPLLEVADKRILKRLGRPRGTLMAILSAQVIDPSGATLEDEVGVRTMFPPFEMVPGVPLGNDPERCARLSAIAMAASDLQDYGLAERSARTALGLDPDRPGAYELWQGALAALAEPVAKSSGASPQAWTDRSYRLRPPLLPAGCVLGGDTGAAALWAFLLSCGMSFPEGASASLSGDGDDMAVLVHNRRVEIDKFESGLAERLLLLDTGWVAATVEMISEAPVTAKLLPGLPGKFSLVGVLTDEQYQAMREQALDEQGKITVLPRRVMAPGKPIDAFEGLPLGVEACLLETRSFPEDRTIEALLSPGQFRGDTGREKKELSKQETSTCVTMWDGQWLALGGPGRDGAAVLVIVQLESGRP
jgi:hypothetical protein